MRKRLKYHFNHHELKFIHYRPSQRNLIFRLLGATATILVVSVFTYSTILYQQKGPDDKKLKYELSQYKQHVKLLNQKLGKITASMANLQERDNEIYRTIFEAEPLPAEVLNAGTGGSQQYEDLLSTPSTEMLAETHIQFDRLTARMRVLDKSYQELQKLARKQEKRLASIPAVQPIRGRAMNHIVSGFGNRVHPIYKTVKVHTGIDFTASKGTPIYATGDGVIKEVKRDGGYGLHVIISHGFGYQTLYGHMSATSVKAGERIKRGQMIGKVGSTGLSVAPHLHYEVMKGGVKINPIDFFHNDLKPGEFDQLVKHANQSNQSFD